MQWHSSSVKSCRQLLQYWRFLSIIGDMPKLSKNAEATNEFEADFYYALADRARTLRGRQPELTLTKCGALMGITESMASLKFKGAKWSAFEVGVMADAFGVSPAVLFGSEAMPDPTRPARVTTLDASKNVGKSRTKDYGYDVSNRVVQLSDHRHAQRETHPNTGEAVVSPFPMGAGA